jgi:hypothetical protein
LYVHAFMTQFPLLRDMYNQDTSCTQPLVATGKINNYCYEEQSSSTKLNYPYGYSYESSDCTGTATVHEIDENSCSLTTGEDDDDDDFAKDNSYQSFYHYVSTGDGSDNEQNSLSTGIIVGIAVGGAAGLIVMCLCWMWCFKAGIFAAKVPLGAQQDMQGRV